MPKVTFIALNGERYELDGESGTSLMETALAADVPGIDADCGGSCSCATCHVYVDAAWRERVGGPNELENGMLDFNASRGPGSRLSCQIPLNDELDGLVVQVAEHG